MKILLPVQINGQGSVTYVEFADAGFRVYIRAPSDNNEIAIHYETSKLEWAKLLSAGSALLLEETDGQDNC